MKFSFTSKLFPFIAIFHFIVVVFTYVFIKSFQFADANKYWFKTVNAEDFINFGYLPFRDNFIYYLNYIPAVVLGLPFWCGFLIYSLIGLLGIYFLYKTFNFNKSKNLFIYLVLIAVLFLPSMHFWTSVIGKEPILFLALSLVFYGISRKKIRLLLFVLGFVLIGIIRPHIAMILLFSLILGILFSQKKLNLSWVITFILVSIISSWILVKTSWLPDISISSLQNLFSIHHEVLSTSNTYVPLEKYNWFYKIFTFYYRPFPGEVNNSFGWLMSLENLFVLGISIFGIYALIKLIINYKYKLKLHEWTILIFFILLAIVLSLAYSNFGLISRMKNQSMPFMLLLFAYWINLYYFKSKNEET